MGQQARLFQEMMIDSIDFHSKISRDLSWEWMTEGLVKKRKRMMLMWKIELMMKWHFENGKRMENEN
jgi:hypothetical protein